MNGIYFSGYTNDIPARGSQSLEAMPQQFSSMDCSLYTAGFTSKTSPSSSTEAHNQMPAKPKRSRTAFTTYQITELELEYRRNTYMHRPQRIQIAERLSLPERIVKIWFQNRRTKEKKLQKSAGDKRPARSKTQTEHRAQLEIVQRLMSYSDPSIQQPQQAEPASRICSYSKVQSGRAAIMHPFKGYAAVTNPPAPQPSTNLLTPPPTPVAMLSDATTGQISEILNFLEGTSVFQGSSSSVCPPTSHPNDLDIILQTIRNDLKQESSSQQWQTSSQQQALNATPTINLSWGEPLTSLAAVNQTNGDFSRRG